MYVHKLACVSKMACFVLLYINRKRWFIKAIYIIIEYISTIVDDDLSFFCGLLKIFMCPLNSLRWRCKSVKDGYDRHIMLGNPPHLSLGIRYIYIYKIYDEYVPTIFV